MTKTEKKEIEIKKTIKKIEDRNEKVNTLKDKYLKQSSDTLRNVMQVLIPASKPNKK